MKYTRSGLSGEGPRKTKIALILPRPAWGDKLAGEYWQSNLLKFLSANIANAGMFKHQVWITSINSQPDAGDETHEFQAELAYLRDVVGVEVLVPLGNQAAEFFKINDLQKQRGSIYNYEEFFVLPTYHPSEVYNLGGWNKQKGKADYTVIWTSDFAKAKEVATEGWTPPQEIFNLTPSWQDVVEFLESSHRLALDIETTGFGSQAELVMLGLAKDSHEAIVIPFLKQHGEAYWPNGTAYKMKKLLENTLAKKALILQNALFDIPMLRQFDINIPWQAVAHDTMLLHHCLSPEFPHNLGFIVSMYGTTPYWKEDVSQRLGSNMSLDDEMFRLYNARDCVVLHQILEPMLADLAELELEDTYYNESLAMLPAIDAMQTTGIGFNQAKLDIFINNARKTAAGLEADLRRIGSLPEIFNLNSDEDLRLFFFGITPSKLSKLTALDDYKPKEQQKYECQNADCKRRTFWSEDSELCPKCQAPGAKVPGETRLKARRNAGTKAYEELVALQGLVRVRPLFYPTGYRGRSTAGNKIAVNQQGLLGLQRATQNKISYMNNLKNPPEEQIAKAKQLLEFLDKYFEYAGLQKLLTTYKSFTTQPDGRVHTHFLIHGTATGRLSSSNPNLDMWAA